MLVVLFTVNAFLTLPRGEGEGDWGSFTCRGVSNIVEGLLVTLGQQASHVAQWQEHMQLLMLRHDIFKLDNKIHRVVQVRHGLSKLMHRPAGINSISGLQVVSGQLSGC